VKKAVIATTVGEDPSIVMAGLVAVIHALAASENQDVHARDKRGHDE